MSVEEIWVIANTLRIAELKARPLYGLGTDDSHNYFGTTGSSPGRGWVMVRASHLTPEHIVNAIEAGDFYASSGVELRDVSFEPKSGTLEVVVEPVSGASYTIDFIGTHGAEESTTKPGRVLKSVEGTEATYTLSGEGLYVRAVVTSSLSAENPSFEDQRRQAWTQPVGWKDRSVTPGDDAE